MNPHKKSNRSHCIEIHAWITNPDHDDQHWKDCKSKPKEKWWFFGAQIFFLRRHSETWELMLKVSYCRGPPFVQASIRRVPLQSTILIIWRLSIPQLDNHADVPLWVHHNFLLIDSWFGPHTYFPCSVGSVWNSRARQNVLAQLALGCHSHHVVHFHLVGLVETFHWPQWMALLPILVPCDESLIHLFLHNFGIAQSHWWGEYRLRIPLFFGA